MQILHKFYKRTPNDFTNLSYDIKENNRMRKVEEE